MAEPKVLDVDDLIDDILAKKGPQKYTDGLSEDNWEQVSTSWQFAAWSRCMGAVWNSSSLAKYYNSSGLSPLIFHQAGCILCMVERQTPAFQYINSNISNFVRTYVVCNN